MTAKEYARKHYDLDNMPVEAVTIESAIHFAEAYAIVRTGKEECFYCKGTGTVYTGYYGMNETKCRECKGKGIVNIK